MSGDDTEDDQDGWEEIGGFTSADPSDAEPADDDEKEPTETVVEPEVIDVESSETTEHGDPDDPFEELKAEYSSDAPESRDSDELFEEIDAAQPSEPIETVEADQGDTDTAAGGFDADQSADPIETVETDQASRDPADTDTDTNSTADAFDAEQPADPIETVEADQADTDQTDTDTDTNSTADAFDADQPSNTIETVETDQADTDQADTDRHTGVSESPDADTDGDVFEELDAEQPATAEAPDAEEIFDEMDVSEVDGEALWDELAGLASQADTPVAAGTEPTVDSADLGETLSGGPLGGGPAAPSAGSDEAVVDKRQYCQQCPYFSEPPDVACSHEGTSIVEVLMDGQFRLRGCPVVTDSGPDRTILEDGP